jgi:F-type H+-transporting ATPase subunit delta
MLLDKKRGVLRATVECVSPIEDDFKIKIVEAIKKQTGAATVELKEQLNLSLIGGYRLRMGDEVIDASIRSQLRYLGTCLSTGLAVAGKPAAAGGN